MRIADSCLAGAPAEDSGTADADAMGLDAEPPPDGAPPDAPVDTGTDAEPDVIEMPACASKMLGKYAVRDTTFVRADLDPFGPSVLANVDYKFVEIEQAADGTLQLTAELRYAETLDDKGSPSMVPDQNITYLAGVARSQVYVDCDENEWWLEDKRLWGGFTPRTPPGCEDGASTSATEQGAVCDCPKPGSEELVPGPNDANDCRIRDDDHDGKPGVSVIATFLGIIGGKLYVAFDREGYMEGSIADDQHHPGRWNDTGSQTVALGCDELSFLPLSCPKPVLSPCIAEHNSLIFVPAPDLSGCNAVVAAADSLFASYPIVPRPGLNECL